ncbi:hypothetical protein BpHYR1_011772 [Brachionus plicatilis]|uniref:Uncharacterized protein n=1 Tax=Brachionus plicatilis TaxID=10195 RepID=A0A3M7Q4E6_BRAPC|nr:hypothetical protein BpHYR1_011772 [Brachionus plicatilis]
MESDSELRVVALANWLLALNFRPGHILYLKRPLSVNSRTLMSFVWKNSCIIPSARMFPNEQSFILAFQERAVPYRPLLSALICITLPIEKARSCKPY